MSADELDVEFDLKKIKKTAADDALADDDAPVVVDPDAEDTGEEDEEEAGLDKEELNPFGDRWEE